MVDRRQEILAAALALADEQGLAAVSMRGVAARLGVTPMALYGHVETKERILDGLVDRLLAELLPDLDALTAPRDRLLTLARSARTVAKAHPAVFPLLFARPAVTSDAVRVVDAIYQALLAMGLPAAQVPRWERLLSTFVLGFATSEVNGRFAETSLDQRARRGEQDLTGLAGHGALAGWLRSPVDWDAEFEADLADLLRLIEAAAAGGV